MENKTKNMLIVAMEESAEITQACSKAIRFGLVSRHPSKKKTHNHEILIEYYHLQAIIEKLQNDKSLPVYTEGHIKNIKENKIAKMEKYMNKEV